MAPFRLPKEQLMTKKTKAIVLTVTEKNNTLVTKAAALFTSRFRERTKTRLQE